MPGSAQRNNFVAGKPQLAIQTINHKAKHRRRRKQQQKIQQKKVSEAKRFRKQNGFVCLYFF